MEGTVVTRLIRRGLLAGASAFPVGAALVACGQGAEQGAAPASQASGKVVYLSQSAGGDARQEQETALFNDFNKQHGKVTVEVVVVGGAGGGGLAKEKFIVSAAGGQPMDVVQNSWGVWTDLSEGGVIAELTPYYKRDKINLGDFMEGAIQAYTLDGKTWAEPVTVSADALFYNADLFRAAGIAEPPQNPEDKSWTMEKFLDMAQKLTRGTEQYGHGGSVSSFNVEGLSCGSYFGQQAWDDAKRKCLMDQPNSIKGLTFFQDLIWKQRAAPSAAQATALRGSAANVLYTGKVAMNHIGPFNPPKLDFKWGVAALPYSGTGKNQSARIWPHGLHIVKGKTTDAAWELLKWLSKPENGGRFPGTAGHAVSPLLKGGSDIAQRAYLQQHGVDAKAFALQAINTKPAGNGLLRYKVWPDISRELAPLYAQVQNNEMAVGEYAKRSTEVIDRLAGPGK
ncbi:MAG TPA: extracellular solute-binding protein [Chloroflexota bacterium]|nr:extracellular solute-binding protein [Chloroflexota bacterium]